MTAIILEGLAAYQLLLMAVVLRTRTPKGHIVYRLPAAVLGTALGAMVFGRFMGWPV